MKLAVFLALLLILPLTQGLMIKGDSVIYANPGELNNPTNIVLNDEPLFIFDDSTNQLKAYFNLPPDQDPSKDLLEFQPLINITESNSSTGFIGNVNNFDNINGQSRFKETNINSGTSASAAFVAENDIGFTTAFGIGSSNFQFAGTPFPNSAAVFHQSPGEFNFANGFKVGWNWIANNQSGAPFNFFQSMSLSPEGNLDILGNITGDNLDLTGDIFVDNIITSTIDVDHLVSGGDFIGRFYNGESFFGLNFFGGNFFGVYDWLTPDIFLDFNGTELELDIINVSQNLVIPHGEMFVSDNLVTTVITSAGVYVDIETFVEGLTNTMIYNNSALFAELNGTYKLDYAITIVNSNNRNYKSSIAINGNATNKCVAARRLQSNDFGNMGSTCMLSLVEGDNVTLQIQNIGQTDNVIITDGNLNMMKIS